MKDMKTMAEVLLCTLALAATVTAGPLCNTGVASGCGAVLAAGATLDPNWTVEQTAVYPSIGGAGIIPPTPGNAYTVVPPDSAWLPADGASDWINPLGGDTVEAGDNYYTYQTTFTGSAAIEGRYSSDNQTMAVYLNGVLVPPSELTLDSANSFNTWTAFDITTGLNSGTNTLDFVVYNLPASFGPDTVTGFRLETTPELSSLALIVGGCLLLGVLVTRRRSAA